MKKKMFEPGEKLNSVGEVAEAILFQKWLFYRHKPMHWGYMQNMSIRNIQVACQSGYIRYALRVVDAEVE